MSNSPFRLLATNSASQSVADNTISDLVCDTTSANSINVGTRASSTTYVAAFSGLYILSANYSVISAAAGEYEVFVTLNSSTVREISLSRAALASARVDMSISKPVYLTAGDIVHFSVLQVSGGAVSIGTTADTRTKIAMVKISD